MTRSQQLRADIAQTIQEVKEAAVGCDVGSTIARLADVEVKSVVAEISYRKHKRVIGEIDFFEPPAAAPVRPRSR